LQANSNSKADGTFIGSKLEWIFMEV
jgi:hypothetical protein